MRNDEYKEIINSIDSLSPQKITYKINLNFGFATENIRSYQLDLIGERNTENLYETRYSTNWIKFSTGEDFGKLKSKLILILDKLYNSQKLVQLYIIDHGTENFEDYEGAYSIRESGDVVTLLNSLNQNIFNKKKATI